MPQKIFPKKLKILSTLILLGFLSNCATVSVEQMKQETQNFELPKLPKNNEAVIYVVRPSMVGTLVRFNVFLDDKESNSEMGYNRGNEHIYFSVKPGTHEIFSKAENWAKVSVEANSGDTIFIEQHPGLGFIMARNSLSILGKDEGKYYVKKSYLGTVKRLSK